MFALHAHKVKWDWISYGIVVEVAVIVVFCEHIDVCSCTGFCFGKMDWNSLNTWIGLECVRSKVKSKTL